MKSNKFMFIDVVTESIDKRMLPLSDVIIFARSIQHRLTLDQQDMVDRIFINSVGGDNSRNFLSEEKEHPSESEVKNLLKEMYDNGPVPTAFTTIVEIHLAIRLEDGSIKQHKLTGSEREVLNSFFAIVHKSKDYTFAGYDISADKLPTIIRRAFVLDISIPDAILLTNKKPWENNCVDIGQIWKAFQYSRAESYEAFLRAFNVKYSTDVARNLMNLVLITHEIYAANITL